MMVERILIQTYEFEAVASVTRLKRFKTAAACVKWLNDRQK